MLMSPKEKKYTERIGVFFTKEQLDHIRSASDKVGLDVSAFVRMSAIKEADMIQPMQPIKFCKPCVTNEPILNKEECPYYCKGGICEFSGLSCEHKNEECRYIEVDEDVKP